MTMTQSRSQSHNEVRTDVTAMQYIAITMILLDSRSHVLYNIK